MLGSVAKRVEQILHAFGRRLVLEHTYSGSDLEATREMYDIRNRLTNVNDGTTGERARRMHVVVQNDGADHDA